MNHNQLPEDLSIEELRRLLVEKRRKVRQERLERYRRTGRVVRLASDVVESSLDYLDTNQLPDEALSKASGQRKRSRKWILDNLLLVIEAGAVIALLFLLLSGLKVIRDLNLEVAEVLELPTLTPTPLIMAIILPSGHTPPNSPSGAAPNEAEIPEHLRPLVQSLPVIPAPTPGPQQAVRLQIPSIKVDAPVVQGDGWEQLKKGVGQHLGSANPGEVGNVVLSAHNDVFGEIFRDLEKLKSGDQIILFTQKRSFIYIVTSNEVVEPTQVEVMEATTQPVVTLISCYPYLVDNKRIIIRAHLQSGIKE